LLTLNIITQTLNPDEINLVEFIQPVIAWRSAEDAVFGLTYQLKNKGLQTQNGDYSASVSRNEVAFGMEHYAQKASFFEQRLIRWLLVNRNLFPQFIDLPLTRILILGLCSITAAALPNGKQLA
jgi:hypothetical protein